MGYKVGWFVLRFSSGFDKLSHRINGGMANVGKNVGMALSHADVKSANLTGINIPVDTPFKAIYSAQTANEDHVLITPGAVAFIRAKLLSSTCN